MARTAKVTKPATTTAAKAMRTAKAAKAPRVAAAKRAPAAPAPAPKVSKDELRARLDKLERANATLRASSREANRAAKTAAARIAELEDQVARLEKQVARQTAAAKGAGRTTRRDRGVDPGDAVPPGVAVEEPAPLDAEAETPLENLEHHLGGE